MRAPLFGSRVGVMVFGARVGAKDLGSLVTSDPALHELVSLCQRYLPVVLLTEVDKDHPNHARHASHSRSGSTCCAKTRLKKKL